MLPEGIGADGRIAFPLRLQFALRGTEALSVAPLADDNRIVLDSPWPHPQFNGDFLPRSHRIDARGFHAEWDVSSLASNAQARYRADAKPAAGNASPHIDAIGLSLVEPVNLYSKVDRATKYGVLFVLLTFTGFFMGNDPDWMDCQLPLGTLRRSVMSLRYGSQQMELGATGKVNIRTWPG